MILNAFFSGLAIGLSLIIAIGSQNAFVLRQGLTGKYVWLSILFCTGSDCILIFVGTFGIGAMLFPYFESLSSIIYLLTALWVGFYGFLRLRTAINYNNSMTIIHGEKQDFLGVISSLFLMTWLNPHVYLDTVILIGSLSIPFGPSYLLPFAFGASLASLIFFSALGLGASKLSPFVNSPKVWTSVELLTALVMFSFCLSFLRLGGWI